MNFKLYIFVGIFSLLFSERILSLNCIHFEWLGFRCHSPHNCHYRHSNWWPFVDVFFFSFRLYELQYNLPRVACDGAEYIWLSAFPHFSSIYLPISFLVLFGSCLFSPLYSYMSPTPFPFPYFPSIGTVSKLSYTQISIMLHHELQRSFPKIWWTRLPSPFCCSILPSLIFFTSSSSVPSFRCSIYPPSSSSITSVLENVIEESTSTFPPRKFRLLQVN